MESLLDQFFAEEATPYVRDMIGKALEENQFRTSDRLRRFEFNRFEVTLDFESRQALIEDVLRPGAHGEQRVDFSELAIRLGSRGGA